jgi:hypothetical protein
MLPGMLKPEFGAAAVFGTIVFGIVPAAALFLASFGTPRMVRN